MTIDTKYRWAVVAAVLSLSPVFGTTTIFGNPIEPKSEPRLEELTVRNWDEESHAVTVMIERDDELVHWETVRLNGTVENPNGISEFDRAAVPVGSLGDRIERYTVFVRVDGSGSGERYEFASRVIEEILDSCERDEHLQIAVTVRDRGGPGYSVTCER